MNDRADPSPGDVRTLSRLVGLAVPEEDLEPLAERLREHAAAMRALETLDLAGVEPPLVFELGRWD